MKQQPISRLLLLILFAALFITACGGGEAAEPPIAEPAETTAVEENAPETSEDEETAAAPDPTPVPQEEPAPAETETAVRGNTQFTISGAREVDTPQAFGAASPLPDIDSVAIQLKTTVQGSRAPAIIYLDNVPRTTGEFDLSGLSFDDPQPGIVEAGVDILDEEASGVYPYDQYAENVAGILMISDVADGQLAGSFEFTADLGGDTITVTGTFANVTLP